MEYIHYNLYNVLFTMICFKVCLSCIIFEKKKSWGSLPQVDWKNILKAYLVINDSRDEGFPIQWRSHYHLCVDWLEVLFNLNNNHNKSDTRMKTHVQESKKLLVMPSIIISVSTECLKWRPMPDKMQEFTLCHNLQRHFAQSEDWIYWVSLVTRTWKDNS